MGPLSPGRWWRGGYLAFVVLVRHEHSRRVLSAFDGVLYTLDGVPSAGEARKNWAWVAAKVVEVGGGRKTASQCKMRWERILNPGVKKGLWTKEEDEKLKEVAAAMDYKWSTVSESYHAGTRRY